MIADKLCYWSRKMSSGTVLGKIARLPFRLIPKRAVLPILSGPSKGLKWMVRSTEYGWWTGTVELEVQRAFCESVKSGDVVYDIGGNVGFYTLLASRLVGSAGKVVTIEPVPANLAFLRRHIALNGCDNVDVLDVVVTSESGDATLVLVPVSHIPSFPLASIMHKEIDGHYAGSQIRVRATTLDDIVLDGAYPPPNFIKMDIEGAECRALEGGRKTISRFKPKILLSVHGDKIKQKCLAIFDSLNYRCCPLEVGRVKREDELLCVPR
ncbi:MAG: FkbM family methyltransferase [Planctomycetota bacterium]